MVSSRRTCAATGSFAEIWGPRFKALTMCSLLHGAPVSTGHPLLLYWCNSGAAGCLLAMPRGHIRPHLPISSFTGFVVGIMLDMLVLFNVGGDAIVLFALFCATVE